jgi:hypothetical protein
MKRASTIVPDKQRRIFLYCRSKEEKIRYTRLSEEAGASLNQFLLNCIENGLNPPAQPVSNDVVALSEELNKTRDELRIARILIERYQGELQKAKEAAPSLQINRDLLELFRRARKPLTEEEICYELTSPKIEYFMLAEEESRMVESKSISWNKIQITDIESIAKQLETLEMMGLISKFANGWAWNG